MSNISILDNGIRISTPFIKVKLGDHVFGIYSNSETVKRTNSGVYRYIETKYPNYIQSLKIAKINGQVNQYTLSIRYAVTENNDPNFFEKIFSQISSSRKIEFSYGDLSAPNFLYKNEEALITNITENFDIQNSVINYEISAVSSSQLANSFACNFKGYNSAKPSDLIYELLKDNSKYGLLDIYTGMRDLDLVEQKGLIARDDRAVKIEAKENISVLEYLQYLVNCMQSSTVGGGIYIFKTIDDTSGDFGGPYFKITNSKYSSDSLDTYELDIGYPSANVVTSFSIDNNESFSILYNHSKELNSNEYIERIGDDGKVISIYSPIVGSNNSQGVMKADDQNWWRNVTQYPISAQIKIKGVLRPAILMSKLRLKVYFYGKLHIASGLYVINKQLDEIGLDGCWTTLNIVRVGGDNSTFD